MREDKKPRPPEELVGALHDRTHPTSGRLIAATKIVSEERLSEDGLDDVIEKTVDPKCHECDGRGWFIGIVSEHLNCETCSGSGFFALSSSVALSAFRELRYLRAALPSAEERERLLVLHDYLSHKAMDEGDPTGHIQDWIAALARLVEERGA